MLRKAPGLTVFADRQDLLDRVCEVLAVDPRWDSSSAEVPIARPTDPSVAVLAWSKAVPGTSLVSTVRSVGGHHRVLVVLPSGTAMYVPMLLQAGVTGFVKEPLDAQELRLALLLVSKGAVYVAAALRQVLVPRAEEGQQVASSVITLRERQVLRLIAEGYTHAQAARRMGLAAATVDTYVKRIRAKLGARNKAELTRKAMELGIAADQSCEGEVAWLTC